MKTIIKLTICLILLGCIASCKDKKAKNNQMPQVVNVQIRTDSLSQEEEIAIRDSLDQIRWAKEQEEALARFNALPKISAEEIAAIAPVIKKWTDFYKLDIAQARLVYADTVCFNCTPTLETQGIHYREFGKEEDTDKRIDVDYSPDKQKYVDLQAFSGYEKKEDGKYDFLGWDDGWEIYLIDRKQKYQNAILWVGSNFCAEAVFWKSNNVFMIAGHKYGYGYDVWVFDIAKKTKTCYQITAENAEHGKYMNKVYWKEKGIIVNEQ